MRSHRAGTDRSGALRKRANLAIHWCIDNEWRRHGILAQGGDESRGFPMSLRQGSDQSFSSPTAAAKACHIGGRSDLIDEHQLGRIFLRGEDQERCTDSSTSLLAR